eukprot:UN33741
MDDINTVIESKNRKIELLEKQQSMEKKKGNRSMHLQSLKSRKLKKSKTYKDQPCQTIESPRNIIETQIIVSLDEGENMKNQIDEICRKQSIAFDELSQKYVAEKEESEKRLNEKSRELEKIVEQLNKFEENITSFTSDDKTVQKINNLENCIECLNEKCKKIIAGRTKQSKCDQKTELRNKCNYSSHYRRHVHNELKKLFIGLQMK